MNRSPSVRHNNRRLSSAGTPALSLLGCPASHETRRAAPRSFVLFLSSSSLLLLLLLLQKKGGRERSLNHSHTKSCGYHVLQKCDKAQQLRALAPPPLGFFFFFFLFFSSSPSPHQSLFMALLLLRLTPSGTSPWISLCRNPGPRMGGRSLECRCGDFKQGRI